MSKIESTESRVLDAVFSGAGGGLCLLDPRGRVLRANAEWIDGALLTGQDVVGQSIWDLLLDAPADLRRLHEQARRGDVIDIPRRAFGQSGREPWHTSRLTPVTFDDGIGLLVTSFRGRARTPSEEAIRVRDDRLRSVLDTMLEGCQLVDREWRYTYVNAVAAQHGRRRPEDLIGHTMMEEFPGIEKTPVFAACERCMADGNEQRLESRFDFPDGTVGWFEISVEPQPDGIFILSVDITDRKLAEASHRSVQAQLAAVVDASPVAIVALDLEERIVLWSAAAERMFGWSAAELVGTPVAKIFKGQEEEAARLRARVMAGEGVTNFRTTRSARDGRFIPVQMSADRTRGADGEPNGVVALFTDLTEQAALREALVESDNRFAAAFEATPIAKVLLRVADRSVVETNRAFLTAVGLHRYEVVGKTLSSLPLGQSVETQELFWSAVSRAGRIVEREATFMRPGQEKGDAIISAERIAMNGEDFVLVDMQDVTARKKAEVALKESDTRFRQLADTIEEVFWLTEMDKGAVIYVSPGYAKIWGRSVTSLYANPREWIEAIHPDDRERVLHAAMTKQALGTYDEEYRIVRPDGEIRWIRDRGFPVRGADGTVVRVAGAALDITSRRVLEEQLRQTQKMESIGLLAGGVAHDFNNVLTTIAGTCDALSEILPTHEDASELVEEIRKAGERATGLTRQLLAFSRREVMEVRVVDLAAVVSDTQKMLDRILGEDILLTLSLGDDAIFVKVDPGSWVQILMNLAVNARDAMPRGGKLVIETYAMMIHEGSATSPVGLAPGRYAVLSVTDTGVGMSAEIQARIFEPFFTTKNVGNGTTFRIYVPTTDAPPVVVKAVTQQRDTSGSETILVVEDEPAIRRVVIRALTKLGYAVLQAGNGVEALEVVSEHAGPINLLVTDVVMPHMDGRELAEALAARYVDMRVLYTSGYTDDAVMRHGIQHAEVAFLAKPYDLSSLQRKVRDVLDRV